MKKTIIAALIALGILVAGIPPANAAVYGQTCNTYSYSGASGRFCIAVNVHDFYHWHEALFTAKWGDVDVYVDYLKLERPAGTIIKQNNTDVWYQGGFGAQDIESTDWDGSPACENANNWRAIVRFKIRPYQNSGSGSQFFTAITPTLYGLPTCF
jgi:hypothetical protein